MWTGVNLMSPKELNGVTVTSQKQQHQIPKSPLYDSTNSETTQISCQLLVP